MRQLCLRVLHPSPSGLEFRACSLPLFSTFWDCLHPLPRGSSPISTQCGTAKLCLCPSCLPHDIRTTWMTQTHLLLPRSPLSPFGGKNPAKTKTKHLLSNKWHICVFSGIHLGRLCPVYIMCKDSKFFKILIPFLKMSLLILHRSTTEMG